MLKTLLTAATLAVSAGTAGAASITGFGSPTNAIVGGVVEDFGSAPIGEHLSLTLGNVTIVGLDGPFKVDGANNYYNTSGRAILSGGSHLVHAFAFLFATPVNAFAFNWGAADVNWTLVALDSEDRLLDVLQVSPTSGLNGGEYFGIAAPGIASARLMASADDYVFLDNLTMDIAQTVAPVPLPATGLLLLSTLGGVGGLSLRRKRRVIA